MITRAQLLAQLAGPQPGGIATGNLINEVFDRIEALETTITALRAGVGITLPTSEPALAGSLWADTLVVKVSDGP